MVRPVSAAAVVLLSLASSLPAHSAGRPEHVSEWAWERTEDGREAELIVVLREQADLSAAETMSTKEAKGLHVFAALRDVAERTQAPLRRFLETRGVESRAFYIVNGFWLRGDRELVLELASRSDVARVEGNPRVWNPLPEPGLPVARRKMLAEWGIQRTGAPEVWSLGYDGQGIVVGGQDTGVRWTHDAIIDQYRGWDGAVADHDYNWHDSIHDTNNDCGADLPEPCDDGSHGTHTVATAIGWDGGANMVGMAPGAQWIACRNMEEGFGTPASYLECFEFFLAPYPVGGDPAMGDPFLAPDVTNNSWACPPSEGCSWDTLLAAVQAQRAAGIFTVASAGNSGSDCGTVNSPPAIYDEVYSIGAINDSDDLAGFSSRGPADDTGLSKPDIVAPGVAVRSARTGDDSSYGNANGTSMASPHVAGAVALLWSARPDYRADIARTEELLNRTARRLTHLVEACGGDYVDGPNDSWGHGLLDIVAALREADPPAWEVICNDGLDDDSDLLVDCEDSDCVGKVDCVEADHCSDGLDNDADDEIDCEDSDCAGEAHCQEDGNCSDGIDNDVDGALDCADADCGSEPHCQESGNCSDGVDNDVDGATDCADADCIGACPEDGNCSDGLDNDDDGATDCADADCIGACPEDGNCSDGLDNDDDGATDCADADCIGACPEAGNCSDGLDNDDDGATDCADADCVGACPEDGNCSDGLDNDDDGAVDCADADCIGACPEDGNCSDGLDNDDDGAADCADADCIGACPEDGNCSDGLDNDDDGAADCADADCIGACPEAGNCSDGLDNDDDGATDCADADCIGACPEAGNCSDGLDNDDDGVTDCLDADCWPDVACPLLAVRRGVSLTAAGPSPRLADVFSLVCGGTRWRLCAEEIVPGDLASGLVLSDEALPVGGRELRLFEHSDPGAVLRVRREGSALVIGSP